MTTDNELVVFHGGDDGEMPPLQENSQPVYVYDLSIAEVREYYAKTSKFNKFKTYIDFNSSLHKTAD